MTSWHPGAWIFNYFSPTSIGTTAVERLGSGRIIGMCDQSNVDNDCGRKILDLHEWSMEVDWLGLNHATWAAKIRLDGTDASALVSKRLGSLNLEDQSDPLFRRLAWIGHVFGLLPNSDLAVLLLPR